MDSRFDSAGPEPSGRRGSFEPRPRKEGEIDALELGAILDEAIGLGLRSIKLTGGEPLFRSDSPELCRAVGVRDLPYIVETNGTLLPDGLLEVWREHPPFHVAVSIDSADGEHHDSFRGVEGAFDRTTAFSRLVSSMGVPVQVISSIVRPERMEIVELARLARSIGASSLKLNPVVPLGRGRSLVGENESDERAEHLLGLERWIESELGDFVQLSLPCAFVSIHRLAGSRSCSVLNNLGLLPEGDLSICTIGLVEPRLVFGNVRREGLESIWRDSPVLEDLRNKVPGQLEGICSRCLLRDGCMGYCVAQTYCRTGSFTAPWAFCEQMDRLGLFPSTREVAR